MQLVSRRIETALGEFVVAASEKGICRISFPAEPPGKWFPWFDRYFAEIPTHGDHPFLDRLERQLAAYFSRELRQFDVPLDLRGTEFYLRVWNRLLEIPYGTTVTYGELAREAGIGGGSRAIGNANGSNPVPIVVPCHRVIGSNGRLVGFGGGLELKERLLELEGARIPFAAF